MAGSFTKSTKKDFVSASPKPKQASILSFFTNQKQKSPESSFQYSNSQYEELKMEPILACDDSLKTLTDDSKYFKSFDFENDAYFDQNLKAKKNCLEKMDFFNNLSRPSNLIIPKILNDLSETTVATDHLDDFDSTTGRYAWLINIKDSNGRKKGESGYDGRTLHIPDSAWAKFTAFEKQFWEIKCNFFDTVVFFKKGKFFELYENDADIGAREFNLKMVERVNMRMAGVPEATFDFWAAKFVGKGYKVAKVDQLENAVSKNMREKSEKSKSEKIIRRELTSVLTCGTLVDGNHLKSDSTNYCVSFKITEASNFNEFNIGAAFVEASSAKFYVLDIEDDSSLGILSTFLTQISPKEIIFEKGQQYGKVVKFVKAYCPNASFVFQDPVKEFWDISKTATELDVREYFGSGKSWPTCLLKIFETQSNSFSAFGSIVSYLRVLKLDFELLSYCDVACYEIMKNASSMIVDGQAVEHLSVCSSSNDQKNSLLGILDHCATPSGRRLLRNWILHPLLIVEEIKYRQEAVNILVDNFGFLINITKLLKSIPDLERLATRIHAGSLSIKSFVNVLNGFKSILKIKDMILNSSEISQSKLIFNLGMSIPDYSQDLDYFFTCFNHAIALRDGVIEIVPGSYIELDQAKACVSELETNFENYLKEQAKILKIPTLKYRDIGKEIYQIEIPEHVIPPNEYMILSKTKSVKRYWTPELRRMVSSYVEAKEKLANTQELVQSRLYEKFSSNRDLFKKAIDCVASIDCLTSIASFSKSIPEPRCSPTILYDDDSCFIARDLRHPIVACFCPDEFVPNDIHLSSKSYAKHVMIITGANMGGKSTLLRQVGLASILAQIGSWVPARELSLTPFDRIFTRLGANDNIIGGESTFKVELAETAKILKYATSKSLIIIDELGRGTSTFDGISIAEAVLHYLIYMNRAIVLFSTHYNMLCDSFRNNINVGMYFMNCIVNEEKKSVTFLYKLIDGVSPKSYGIHVAHMAGIPISIIEKAEAYSNNPNILNRSGLIEVAAETSDLSSLILKHKNIK